MVSFIDDQREAYGVEPISRVLPIVPSVGGVGDAYDNSLAETINRLYKAEVIRKNGPWRNLEEVEFATLAWVA